MDAVDKHVDTWIDKLHRNHADAASPDIWKTDEPLS